MNMHDLGHIPAGALARLMELEEAGGDWSNEDLAALFRHQLSLSIHEELERLRTLHPDHPAVQAPSSGALRRTIGDALFGPRPELELLTRLKTFAKAEWKDPESAMPRQLAIALYFLSIAAAVSRCGRHITALDPVHLAKSFHFLLSTAWLDVESRALLREGLRCLGVTEAP